MTEQAPVPKLDRMIALVEGGKSVTQAIGRVYGCRANYYGSTTPEERARVYCKPPRKEGIVRIKIAMPHDKAEALAELAKQEGTTVTKLVKRLVVERLTLTHVPKDEV